MAAARHAPGVDDAALVDSCRKRPLGAFYRVDAQRLDDMQSAISELHAIVASARVHDGWSKPVEDKDGNFVIRKTDSSRILGGHAFALGVQPYTKNAQLLTPVAVALAGGGVKPATTPIVGEGPAAIGAFVEPPPAQPPSETQPSPTAKPGQPRAEE